jgi:hypothetical protein
MISSFASINQIDVLDLLGWLNRWVGHQAVITAGILAPPRKDILGERIEAPRAMIPEGQVVVAPLQLRLDGGTIPVKLFTRAGFRPFACEISLRGVRAGVRVELTYPPELAGFVTGLLIAMKHDYPSLELVAPGSGQAGAARRRTGKRSSWTVEQKLALIQGFRAQHTMNLREYLDFKSPDVYIATRTFYDWQKILADAL